MQPLQNVATGTLPRDMNDEHQPSPSSPEPGAGSGTVEPPVHVALQHIGANRWCVVDSRYPANDARCLIGYVERIDQVYHAIRLDSSPMVSFDETDLDSVLRDLEPAASPLGAQPSED